MKKEYALSEVIGFLMIVALLGILFSMYLLYVVPIQGRDAEISHMKYITQEFIGLKADIDGLIINNKINLPIARSFELGTLSSVGSGALSVMPMSSFIEASGTLMVNEQNDFLMVTVNGDLANIGSSLRPQLAEFSCDNYTRCPPKTTNFTIFDRLYNISAKKRVFNDDMVATINLSDIISTYPNGSIINNEPFKKLNASARIKVSNNPEIWDLVLLISDNRTIPPIPIGERTLVENIKLNEVYGTNFTYNLLSDNDFIANDSSKYYIIHANPYIPLDNFTTDTLYTKVGRYPQRIGSFQYESANRYWVNQNLLYEMGGLFLNQPSDMGSSVMLVPSIALTPVQNITDSSKYDLKVNVNNVRITDTEDVSGSVSAQIFTKIDQISHNLFYGTKTWSDFGSTPDSASVHMYKLQDAEILNAHSIWLQFIPDDPRVFDAESDPEPRSLTIDEKNRMNTSTQLWKRGFDQIKTITNKTITDNPSIGEYSGWIYNFRIEDDSSEDYSANMVVGEKAKNLATKCPPITFNSGACLPEVNSYIQNSDKDRAFILDYTESEVSLVMQSGAL